jgi:hypothetical protein
MMVSIVQYAQHAARTEWRHFELLNAFRPVRGKNYSHDYKRVVLEAEVGVRGV